MFSSNQIFDVSCEPSDLARVIKFGVELYCDDMFIRSDGRVHIAFSGPAPGIYAIGTGSMDRLKSGPNKGYGHDCPKYWADYPFDYDPEIIAGIITQWVRKQPRPECPDTDGSASLGVRVRSLASISDTMMAVAATQPSWPWINCILLFTPVYMTYDK